ncbi:coronatine-insensitive protein homolog 1a isoform X2 [Physcomitrium patens]|uniref:F-box domain-containing protein n=2 Tax=Physcomitrium patens TaxID=3218 RepID=A0A2K1K2P6_PHYPA|nr:coronatine-insensitive protein homolog 1a-like isoform X2 [Physcomitrium patens]PNR48049.1 hypothetical protein PHYPA_012522 [Physcomitrium patens]|eukprot:XP_024384913.1 coronatine-insensitive protein homolog 1a-like isoform X2 [Physcomitrella patens]
MVMGVVDAEKLESRKSLPCGMSDETLACVLNHIESPQDRAAVSMVCQQWRRVDGMTRKFVTIANMYATSPASLTRRFKGLEGIKLKGKPRAAEYNLVRSDWGGYGEPWLKVLGRQYADLHILQLRRLTVLDSDLELIASSTFSSALHVLHLHKCVGFTTKGLLPVVRACRSLRRLSLEDSEVEDKGGEWLHALALNDSTLEELHFGVLGIEAIDIEDLTILVEKSKSLVCLKVAEIELLDMIDVLQRVPSLEDLGAGSCNYLGAKDVDDFVSIPWPKKLNALSGMWSLMDSGLPQILPIAPNLIKLDLKYTLLSCEGHCLLLSHCFSLQELQTRNTLGDDGMETLSRSCKGLKKLRVEDDETGAITQRGIVAVAQGCEQLVQLILYVANISNAALAMVGQGCPHLVDVRIVLEPSARYAPDFPLDDGLKLMLKGCVNLRRLAVYLRYGGLTDKGMEYIGVYGKNLQWLLVGCAGNSDVGLANFAHWAQRIQRLEIRDCPFGETGMAEAVSAMSSLKYLWVQGSRALEAGEKLSALSLPCLNVEVCPPPAGQPGGQLFAYYSLAGPRKDGPTGLKTFISNTVKDQ